MKLINEPKLDFKDVLLVPKRSTLSSRAEIDLIRNFRFKHSSISYEGIPIIAANMDHTGTFEMAKAFSIFDMSVALHKFYGEKELIDFFGNPPELFRNFYTMGTLIEDLDKFNRLKVQVCIPMVCIDVANGYTRNFAQFVENMREKNPTIVIMAGNVVTPDMVYELIQRGADIIKIGIGPGSMCTTRKVTGVGYPQLSAIMECADAAHGAGGHICADGGIKSSGDMAKAFAAGADFVMCGYLFAGHNECNGNIFRGMASKEAMKEHYGFQSEYRASEGTTQPMINKGPVKDTVKEILGGLRSACTYIGAKSLKDLPKCATFCRIA